MKTTGKRILSLLLVLIMLTGIAPYSLAAEETEGPVALQFEAPEATTIDVPADPVEIRPTVPEEPVGDIPAAQKWSTGDITEPVGAPAAQPSPGETAEPEALIGEPDSEHMYFVGINVSKSGAAHVSDWMTGVYGSIYGHDNYDMNFETLKGRLMLRAMSFSTYEYEDPIAYYFPQIDAGKTRELTLYGYHDFKPEDISITGVTLVNSIERHVYGDEGGELYWYTVDITVPDADTAIEISVKGELYATVPVYLIGGSSPVALFSTFAVYDYVESVDDPECIESVTFQISGFSLPNDPAEYNLKLGHWDEAAEEGYACFIPGTEITEENELGYRYLTFNTKTCYAFDTEGKLIRTMNFDNGLLGHQDLMWNDLWIGKMDLENYVFPEEEEPEVGDYIAFFFESDCHLTEEKDGDNTYYFFRADYSFGDDPYFRLGGCVVSMPVPYYSIYKQLPPWPAVRGTADWTGYIEDYDIVVVHDSSYSITIQPGSYAGGEVMVKVSGQRVQDWTAATAGKVLSFDLCDYKGNTGEDLDYGDYNVIVFFRTDGISTTGTGSMVHYTDGKPTAITEGRVIDSVTGMEAEKKGDAYVLRGSEDKIYGFEARVPNGWNPLDLSYPEEQVILFDFYDDAGDVILSRESESCADTKIDQYTTVKYWSLGVKRSEILDAAGVRIYNSGTTPGFTQPGDALDIKLVNAQPCVLRTLLAPTVDSSLQQDENGEKFHAVKVGSTLTATFEASTGDLWSHTAQITYTDVNGDIQTVDLTEEKVGKRSFALSFTIPGDAAQLGSLTYALVNEDTDPEADQGDTIVFDLSAYKVTAEMTFVNFPANFIGTTFHLKLDSALEGTMTEYEKSVVLSEDNIDCISFGDLPRGVYVWDISGKSGHIVGVTTSPSNLSQLIIERGAATDMGAKLSGYVFRTLTITTSGFTSELTGQEVNPPAQVQLSITTPDLQKHTILATTGSVLEELPDTARIDFEGFLYDAASFEEISGVSPATVAPFNLHQNETLAFTFQPFEWRTVKGKVAHPAGGPKYLAQHTTVILTQKVTRGGEEELYTRTMNVDSNGNFSFNCYDHINAKLTFRSYYFGTSSRIITDEGDVDIGSHTLSSTEDVDILVNLSVHTPTTYDRLGYKKAVDKNGYTYDDSTYVGADSGILTVTKLTSYYDGDWHTFGAGDDAFDTYVLDGQLFVRVHPEYLGTTMYLDFKNSVTVGGVDMVLENPHVGVYTNQGANTRYANVTSVRNGGEIWATLVKEDSQYTGFLVHVTGSGPIYNGKPLYTSCEYVCGKGLLKLIYSKPEEYGTVFSFMCRDVDVQNFEAMLASDCTPLLDRAGEVGPINIPLMTGNVFDFGSGRCPIKLNHNAIIKLDNDYWMPNIRPGCVIGSDVLPAYSFTYSLKMGDSADHVVMTGTLKKRLVDEVDADHITRLNVQFYDEDSENMATVSDIYINGQRYYGSWSAGDKDYTELQVRAVLPLTKDNRVNFTINLDLARISFHGGIPINSPKGQALHYEDYVAVFTLAGPDEVYIGDQLIGQKLTLAKPEIQAGWTLKMAMRAFASTNNDENLITVWDNGVKIGEERVWHSLNSKTDLTGSFSEGANRQIKVCLPDNLKAGIHVIYLSRELNGETVYTQPVVLTLLEGRSESGIYVSDLYWTHWNHRRDDGREDQMYFRNLSDLSGETIWIWPSKKHLMTFTINGATAEELENVYVGYHTQVSHASATMNGNQSYFVSWWTREYKTIPCKCISSNDNSKTSVWTFNDFAYMGYLEDFEFQFTYKPPQLEGVKEQTEEERRQTELELYFEADGLGEVPDDTAQVEALSTATAAQIQEALGENAEMLPSYLQNLSMTVTDNAKGFSAKLNKATDQVKDYQITMGGGSEVMVWDVWDLMDQERAWMTEEEETGTKPAGLNGYDVYWGEVDGMQGSTLIRIATKHYQDAQGLWHNEVNRRFYITAAVADAIENGTTIAQAQTARQQAQMQAVRLGGDSMNAAPGTTRPNAAAYDYGDPPDHWTKKTYDFSTNTVTVADMAQDVYVSAVKGTYTTKAAADAAGENAKFLPKCTSNVMNVLGVAETVIQLRNGPSGADPNDLRNLLTHVKDEKFKRSIAAQIRDYDELRESIFIQDMQMKSLSTTSGFVANATVWTKLAVFIGGIGNSILSDKAKEYNRQVYNTTLLDIQRQIKMEKYKAERVEADKQFKEMVRRRFGKDIADNPTRLKEEMKYWHLERDEWGDLVWKLNKPAPPFNTYQDPSGFVFEAVPEERVENVTATLYYSPEKDGSYTVWTDPNSNEALRQANPQSTSDEGRYQWMVPNGWWKVRYEADGYQTTETKPMNVPPIHTAVNIGLLSNEAPTVKIILNTDGSATVLFSKYMQIESLIRLFGSFTSYEDDVFDSSAFAVQFYNADGDPVTGTVTFADKTENTGYVDGEYMQDVILSDYFVRTATFTPTNGETISAWKFADGIVSYAGVPLDTSAVAPVYLVTLDPNSGVLSVPSTVTDEDGHPRSLPSPVREGYTFDGWFSGETQVTLESVLTADTVLLAKWSTVGGYEILNNTAVSDDDTLSVNFVNNTQEADTLQYVIAVYDKNGKQLGLKTDTLPMGSGTVNFDYAGYPDADYIKVFLCGEGGMIPVCEEFYYRIDDKSEYNQ